MGKRGTKAADRSSWFHPGGGVPEKPPIKLTKPELWHYNDLRLRMEMVGVGGNADAPTLVQAARISARIDKLLALLETMDDWTSTNGAGTLLVHPYVAEVSRQESKLRDLFSALYLTPRARGSARLTTNEIEEANTGKNEEPEGLAVFKLAQA
jgi:hypothetical protein